MVGEALPQTWGTPSGEKNLGLELQASVFFRQPGALGLRLDYGVLFPFAAFEYSSRSTQELVEPSTVHTVQARVVFEF